MAEKYTSKKPCGPLTQEECDVWIDALENGGYRQITGALRRKCSYDSSKDGACMGFCALGVLEEAVGKKRANRFSIHTRVLDRTHQNKVWRANDIKRHTFPTIAKMIREDIKPHLPKEIKDD